MTEAIFKLKDGRNLGYAIYGSTDGEPVLYFHGTPSSRLEPLLLTNYNKDPDQLANHYSLCLIAIDRPGIGNSTFDANGSFTSFSHDVNELMAHIKISKCKVLCWSGGGTYVLSIAYHFPQLIEQVYIITGFSRSFKEERVFKNMNGNIYYFWSAKNIPWVMRGIMNFVAKKEAHRPIPKWLSQLPDVDHDLLNQKAAINQVAKVTLSEACRFGSRGIVHEAASYFKETGYVLNQIVQPVHFWWGTKDNTVTRIHAEAVERQVPDSIMHYKENEGHLSIYVNYFEEVLETIAKK
ncbi:MAG TPA: alpha/beta hydrolase [Segetibacter sp.]|jgi:pimeloyl-ACP methyl ester carboxylesterase